MALLSDRGQPIPIVHVSAECWPYARSGGLGEAVSSLAAYQAEAGLPTVVLMPLYRQVRSVVQDFEPIGEPFEVQLGPTRERTRLLRARTPATATDVVFIEHPHFFDRPALYGEDGDYGDNHRRFSFFALAALEALPRISRGLAILHAHDWHAALSLVYLRTRYASQPLYRRTPAVLSVHNAGYQGHFPASTLPEIGLPWEYFNWRFLEWYDRVNWLKGGLVSADVVVTVSATHARELQSPDGGFGLGDTFRALRDRLFGITNGIDHHIWDPTCDQQIVSRFGADDLAGKRVCKAALQSRFGLGTWPRTPLFGMAARLVAQKGLDLLIDGEALGAADAQYIFLGQGDKRYIEPLRALAARYPDRIAVETGFTDALEHEVIAGADLLLMPCQYEPCGLTQMRAQRYGTLPVARRTGGLNDTVDDGTSGFLFDQFSKPALAHTIRRAVHHYHDERDWQRHMRQAMGKNFSWQRSALKYLAVYLRALEEAERAGRGVD
ncbi:MAG TPA: glycogen synthase [Gemmatimonadales bacterium]